MTKSGMTGAPRPLPRADRSFYASGKAFGRFGIRSFRPQVMAEAHSHGHIEFNWLSQGSMDYVLDGRPVTVQPERLVAFWAGIPHQTIGLRDTDNARQINIYLPMDAFLEMPQLGQLTETLMGGGVVQLTPDCAGFDMLARWHADYRSGNALRSDLVRAEIGTMFRRAAVTGWETLLQPWLDMSGPRNPGTAHVRHVVRMVRYIVENISSPLTVEDVAGVPGLHPNYAADLFARVMHVPIQKFVTRMRLIRARSLLFNGNLPVANIGFMAGFGSQTQFHAHFRRAYGQTPSQMRKETVGP
jgi:AraC-like DNA-binding protein